LDGNKIKNIMAKKAKSNPKGGLKMSPYYGVAPKKKKRFGNKVALKDSAHYFHSLTGKPAPGTSGAIGGMYIMSTI
tara:strand:+ start:587 stop:814 length:228 start_codon:yes stop_codon:yes gene_type:complete